MPNNFLIYLVLATALTFCGNSPLQKKELNQSLPSSILETVPAFVDDTDRLMNSNIIEPDPLQLNVTVHNGEALRKIFKMDSEVVRQEMQRRVADQNYPRRLRNLAATVLMVRNDEIGRAYLANQAQILNPEIVDAYWLIGYFGVYGSWGTDEFPDMYWAEDLMIKALQDKRTLNIDEVHCCKYGEQKFIEVRELAIEKGNFTEVLAKMKSQKSLPVVLSLIDENLSSFYNPLRYLGRYEDKSFEPLILEILEKHDDRFSAAVAAAVDLKMKSAVPILLQHLGTDKYPDDNVRWGLDRLADAGILPVLKDKLPALKDYDHAETQLLILKLQSEDSVPELLALLRDRKFLLRSEVIFRLTEIKDNRAVKDLANVLLTDQDNLNRIFAARALASIRTPESIAGLIEGLDANFSNVKGSKVSSDHDFKKDIQAEILRNLKEVTKQDFGTDGKKWREWLQTNRLIFDKQL